MGGATGESPLAILETVPFAALLEEPFIALPKSSRRLRDYWLALDHRPRGSPVRICAEVHNADEAFELIAAGVGIVLLAAGIALIYDRPGIVCSPVHDLSPSQLAVARRHDDRRIAVRDFIDSCTAIVKDSQDRTRSECLTCNTSRSHGP